MLFMLYFSTLWIVKVLGSVVCQRLKYVCGAYVK
jgi:hypothetical protein